MYSRFQFRSALLECTREFARCAMAAGITKRSRAKQIERMRSVVTSHYLQMQNKEWSYICFVELSCVPVRPSEAPYHAYNQKGGAQMKWQARCIILDCKPECSTICAGCICDVCEIERPSLIKKSKRNNSLGVERIPKRQRKSLTLNPHQT